MMDVANVVTLILAVVGSSALGVVIQGFVNRRKISRDTEAIAVTTATGLIKEMRVEMEARDREHLTEVKALRTEMKQLRERLDEAEKKAAAADERADKAEQTGVILGERLAATQQKLARAEQRILQLEAHLRSLGADVPPHPPEE